ncbi:ribonuclease 3-like protein 2 [Solanum stenotomum]|uniref:ribonuclease 3-like protein 2 n=1 Tax=Solanum stenotomum TaxID=172797 RepID=UPI0020D1BCB1|nr:ribonuclease 3-like protein 2 [Solanum stenotomum]
MLAEKLLSMTAKKEYQNCRFQDLSYKIRYSQKLGTLIFSSCPEKKPSTSALLSKGTKKQKFEPPTHTKKQSVFFPGKAQSPCVLVPPENCAVVTDGNRKLLENALTHSSCPNSASNYQRLAFIGNAALGLAISSYFFVTNPDVDCGKLTDLSIADVSTEKLIRAAVRHDLYKCLSRDSAILDEKEEEMEFYGGMIKAPKVLADIVESIMGAVYLDCGFDVNDV